MRNDTHEPSPSPPLVIATILRGDGITGVDTHIRQVRRYLDECGQASTLVTPFSWGRLLTYPVFGLRPLVLDRISRPASVAWYLYWHELFVRNALRRRLARAGDCVVYAQDPFSARAALRVRRGPHQRVVMAVHLRISMADEWADKKQIAPRRHRVPGHPAGGTDGDPTGRTHRVRVQVGPGRAAQLASRSRDCTLRRHRQLRGAMARQARPGIVRRFGHRRQSRSGQEPPFLGGCPGEGQTER